MDYNKFLLERSQQYNNCGFEPIWVPDFLFGFQKKLTEWAILKGRAALFEDCGLGKTPQQLVWAQNVYSKTKKPCLILSPLAVSYQTMNEAHKFNIDANVSKTGKPTNSITIANYEKLHLFNHKDFSGVVCDESSILKNFNGSRKSEITQFMKKVPYRLLATATAAPNDYIELGTSSEALGYLGFIDMLNKFFKNDQSNTTLRRMYGESSVYRLKGHAEKPFWRWVTSWARACRKPSDMGFNDSGFILPDLIEREHLIETKNLPEGYFLPVHAATLPEQREEKKRTIAERCDAAKQLVINRSDQSVIWCHLNDEAKELKRVIPDSIEISGRDKDEKKEWAFIEFSKGNIKNLITKPKIGAWGMNWQNCCHTVTFVSHSYEQYYQAVRRFWRFGQKNNVTVDIVMTEGEKKIIRNLKRKGKQADKMFENLILEMNNSLAIKSDINYDKKTEVPSWL